MALVLLPMEIRKNLAIVLSFQFLDGNSTSKLAQSMKNIWIVYLCVVCLCSCASSIARQAVGSATYSGNGYLIAESIIDSVGRSFEGYGVYAYAPDSVMSCLLEITGSYASGEESAVQRMMAHCPVKIADWLAPGVVLMRRCDNIEIAYGESSAVLDSARLRYFDSLADEVTTAINKAGSTEFVVWSGSAQHTFHIWKAHFNYCPTIYKVKGDQPHQTYLITSFQQLGELKNNEQQMWELAVHRFIKRND